ncbi:NUDIX domain-containing protein [Sphingomonas sp.]|uniref:NUDIX domain-containing protein n=1 Tax=Sphingomonas sp. TaxID=28214 RepID=UPI0035B31D1F
MSDAIPAATLILMRDRADAAPEILMVERAATLAFAGGALVFPGGRIDPADRALADGHDLPADEAAARIAAIRETIEEVGIAVGLHPAPADLSGRPTLAALLGAATLDLAALIPFARWRPDHALARIFDTRFYLACLPANAPPPEPDGAETVRAFWTTAQAALDDADAGRATLIYPTRRTLERLARFGNFADAAVDAARYPVRTITPFVDHRPDGPWLCIPQDCGYPVTAEPLAAAARG